MDHLQRFTRLTHVEFGLGSHTRVYFLKCVHARGLLTYVCFLTSVT